MGADLIRWMYCRHNPAANINFGSGPAEELRSKFILKLWNTYAFFCNYARLRRASIPPRRRCRSSERPDIDRWILSDLQMLIQTAREAFESYNLMAFCLEAEEFVDDKLSNWYVRRNRRRFWKSEQGRRQAGGVSDAVHGADDADEAVRARHAVPDGDDVSEPRVGRTSRRASICAISRADGR